MPSPSLSCAARTCPCRRADACASASRSALIRSSSTDAGSSPGSWGTSLPENACLRMLCRSRSARARLASTVASTCWTTDSRRSTSATMRRCSARGGSGIPNWLDVVVIYLRNIRTVSEGS